MALDVAFALPNLMPTRPTIARSDPLLFEELYERHYADVFRYALVLTNSRDEAEEVAAETFARAWRAWSQGREPDGSPLPWLLVIARNVAIDWWRRLSRATARLLPRGGQDGHAEVESLLWLEALVRVLPPRQREVIVLRYYRDLADAEIGRVMGLSESGVRSLVARAMATLRRHPEVWR
jgi:RNA polymerase sigma factor (sigma-70 family)